MLASKRGFTIIELLVVISVISILAIISVFGFNAIQSGARDSQRSNRITSIAEALEKYYSKNGEYPSCAAMSAAASSVTSTLPGLDPTVLVAPKATATTNSIDPSCATLTTGGSTDKFAYIGDGSTTCATSGCLQYTLQYIEEGSNTVKSLASRHTANIATSGNITNLSATGQAFSSALLTWSAVGNANSYTIQTSTNAFSTYTSTSVPSSPATISSLTPGQAYSFRVLPVSTGSTGNVSNTANATVPHIATPVATATYNASSPSSQLDVSWTPGVSGAATYTLDYSIYSDFRNGSVTTRPGLTTTTQSVTGLTAGTTLYFRVKAFASDDTSSYSTTVNATTIVPVPTGVTAVTNSSTQITVSWTAVPSATTYNIEFALNSGFSGSSMAATGVTGVSKAITSLTQGQIYYFRVYALIGAATSAASASANATTTVSTPGAPGITAYQPGAIRPYASGYWVAWVDSPSSGNWYYAYADVGGSCPAGTYSVFNVESNYNSPATAYYTGNTTATQWFMVQPTSSYHIKFSAQQYCQGANAASGWSGWNQSCASGSGSTEACFF